MMLHQYQKRRVQEIREMEGKRKSQIEAIEVRHQQTIEEKKITLGKVQNNHQSQCSSYKGQIQQLKNDLLNKS